MEPTEKDIVIEKVKKMPEEQVEKIGIFIAGLEAGCSLVPKPEEKGRRGHDKE